MYLLCGFAPDKAFYEFREYKKRG